MPKCCPPPVTSGSNGHLVEQAGQGEHLLDLLLCCEAVLIDEHVSHEKVSVEESLGLLLSLGLLAKPAAVGVKGEAVAGDEDRNLHVVLSSILHPETLVFLHERSLGCDEVWVLWQQVVGLE